MPVVSALLSALANVVLLVVLPFAFYFAWHKLRHRRGAVEIARRAGLQASDRRTLLVSLAVALVAVAALLVWSPPLESFVGEGSPQRAFRGLGWSATAVVMALLYGVVQTGFSEEFLFRGLIAGSLARRLPVLWANLLQAVIFLLPHLLILLARPELWVLLPFVFAGALLTGWLRIRSGSILGPWLIHAALNVATCLSVAVRSAG